MMKYSKLLKIFLIFFLANNSFSSDYSVVRYSAWEKADVDLLYVLPAEVNTETKVLFIIHGASRDADRYLSMWLDAAKDKNVILVAPHFKKMIIHILLRLEWHHTLEKSLKIKAFG